MSTLTILPRAGYKKLPWKNGLGTTLEIAIHPARASAANGRFDFRLSHATVDGPAEFSHFPEHDRVLVVKDGAGLRLIVAAGEARGFPRELKPHVPIAFSGSLALRSELISGPVTDLNIFTRESSVTARVEIKTLEAPFTWSPQGRWAYGFVLAGECSVKSSDDVPTNASAAAFAPGVLRDSDTMFIEGSAAAVFSPAAKTAVLALIELVEKSPAPRA